MMEIVCVACVAAKLCLSCLCFAEISIYFCFGEFRTNSICPIFRDDHSEFLYDIDACMHFYNNLFIITVQLFMMVGGMMVEMWLMSAVQDMNENNRAEILCHVKDAKEDFGSTPMRMVVSWHTCT